ncbi:hypothetical protein GGS20DRAFT_583612 [Poronia punctata]|nr:hypothetical protein GGS20DRAFT_583612 [Poronia punctata]
MVALWLDLVNCFIARPALRTLQTPGRSNGLPQPEEQPEISDTTLMNLGELFVPEGSVLYGIQVQVSGNSESCWTEPVPAKELATKPIIHGHAFHLQPNGAFVPYEFQEGEAPSNAAKVPKAFSRELAEFLHLNNLAGLVALQLLDDPRDRTRTELLIGPQGTLRMDKKDVLGFEPAEITTGWFFQKNTHGVFQDSKPLPTLQALKAALLSGRNHCIKVSVLTLCNGLDGLEFIAMAMVKIAG